MAGAVYTIRSPRQSDNVFRERGLVVGPAPRLALRRAMMSENPADPPLGDSYHSSDMVDAAPAPGGAQKFPWAASWRISLSNDRSDTACRNRPFSFSRSFMRRA